MRPLVARVASLLSEQGAAAYIVGGYVRDLLLGRETRDLDISIADADPIQAARAVADALGGAFYALDEERRYGRAILRVGEQEQSVTLDFTPLHGALEEDLARRDFTLNAMALPIGAAFDPSAVIDPWGGRRDMDARVVRALRDSVFQDDPVRLLRAVRLAGALGSRIDDETDRLAAAQASELQRVSPERVQEEFCRILGLDDAREALYALDRLGLLAEVFPELEDARGVEQPKEHYYDVLTHLLETVGFFERIVDNERREADEALDLLPWKPALDRYFSQEIAAGRSRTVMGKLACLLHDVAKPQTKTVEPSGRTRFLGHPERGAEMAMQAMDRLRFSRKETAFVAIAVSQHLRPVQLSQDMEQPSKRALYRYRRDLGDVGAATLYLSMADYLAAKGPTLPEQMDEWRHRTAYCAQVLAGICERDGDDGRPRPLVDGRLLMQELDLAPGPLVGRLLRAVQEAVAVGEASTVEEALGYARRLLAERAAHANDMDGPRTDGDSDQGLEG
jgi:tRNA nucleotidyltransferase/poly(A) polymerase